MAIAESQVTYDSLITYDMLFFKGGDQLNYYKTYKNNKVHEVVNQVFARGGVIAGTSAGAAALSEVMYTAENSSATAAECIKNGLTGNITLRTDFFGLVPKVLIDTHFAERGRNARLLAFMANYFTKTGKKVVGMGIDDITAVSINPDKTCQAWGTGTVNLFLPSANSLFSATASGFTADSVRVVQLTSGASFDFNTLKVTGLNRNHNNAAPYETARYSVFLFGSEGLSKIENTLLKFVNAANSAAKVLIITGFDTSAAESVKTALLAKGVQEVEIVKALVTNGTSASVNEAVRTAKKYLFVKNDAALLNEFIQTDNGKLLFTKLTEDNGVSAFLGADAALAGKQTVRNLNTPDAAYNAELSWTAGLGLLNSTVVVPAAFANADLLENTMTAVPYTMQKFNLRYGVWLDENIDMLYTFEGNKSYFESLGIYTQLIMENKAATFDFSSTSSSGSGTARMATGFDYSLIYALAPGEKVIDGNELISNSVLESKSFDLPQVFPNPANSDVKANWSGNVFNLSVINSLGQTVFSAANNFEVCLLDTAHWQKGIYFLKFQKTKEAGVEFITLSIQ